MDEYTTQYLNPQRNRTGRVALGILIFIIAGGSIFVALRLLGGDSNQKGVISADRAPQKHSKVALLDSDGDGLSDWEEKLYGTNPHNPDTDADGIPDGEELLMARHPLKPGPGDKLLKSSASAFIPSRDVETNNYYARIALIKEGNLTRTLISSFLKNKHPGDLPAILQSGTLPEEIQNYIGVLKKDAPEFSEDAVPDIRLTIVESGGPASIKNYFNGVAEIYASNLAPLAEKDVEAINDAVVLKKHEALLDLARYRKSVEEALEKIIALPVSRQILLFHKKEIWYLEQTIEQIKLLEAAPVDDPLYIVFLLGLRIDLKNSMARLHAEEIPAWLKKEKVIFTQGDKASLLYPTP